MAARVAPGAGTIDGASNDFSTRPMSSAAAVDAPLVRAAHQNSGRIAPYRLGKGVANVTPGEPDVGEHVLVHPGKNGRIAAIFQGLEDWRGRDPPTIPATALTGPRELRGGLGIGIERHGILHSVSAGKARLSAPRPLAEPPERPSDLS